MRRLNSLSFLAGLAWVAVGIGGCGSNSAAGVPDASVTAPAGQGGSRNQGTGSTSSGGTLINVVLGTGGSGGNPCAANPPPPGCKMEAPPGCGDGKKNQDSEVCDDGNALPGDGCNGICLVEPNWTCPPEGTCTRDAICGDGLLGAGEVCDDKNTIDNDGCNSTCTVQDGQFKCTVGSPCVRLATCGNGRVEQGETCEDGNNQSGDGCSSTCTTEQGWTCREVGKACTPAPRCGDGKVDVSRGEVCDQGQYQGQPGCSADCKSIDAACVCTPGKACECQKPTCGDGKVQVGEQCDDGGGPYPGCSDTCQLEAGYKCPFAGAPCVPVCGDGILVSPAEQCDPGMSLTNMAQACNANCSVNAGWVCDSSSCRKTECGDGKVEGAEGCDSLPKNNDTGDGCTPTCMAEPNCPAGGGGCTTRCGDGLVLGDEECDDANAVSGDGCSSSCKIEAGFQCSQPELGDTMLVPMVVRDFNEGNDFQKGTTFAEGLNYANQGLVQGSLDSNGLKPVLASNTGTYDGKTGQASGIASAASFAQWYNDTAPSGGNTYRGTLAATLNLYLIANSNPKTYVNRYGNAGDGLTSAQFEQSGVNNSYHHCGATGAELKDADGNIIPCTRCDWDNPETPDIPCDNINNNWCQTNTYVRCVKLNDAWWGLDVDNRFDGNPLFFPADAFPKPWSPDVGAQISGNYDQSWPADPVTGRTHNFSFTTEVRFWFKYDSSQPYKLTFVGDDDVWVFINKKLAVDLGGIHTAVQGIITFGSTGAARTEVTPTNVADGGSTAPITSNPDLGLENGKVYEIVVFQAERQTKASSYQLSLTGFNAAHSICKPICGGSNPGVSPGEQCDNGASGNCDPSSSDCYNQCTTSCTLGPRCGDGVVQSAYEQCDNGKNTDGHASTSADACAPGCVLPPFCGDGAVQMEYGEECDKGTNNVAEVNGTVPYGSDNCGATSCLRGGFCGDAIMAGPEACDDGKNDGTYNTCGDPGTTENTKTLPNCDLPPRCGDSVLQDTWGEECDPPGSDTTSGKCTDACRFPGGCGDGIVQTGEQCDDGSDKNTGEYGFCTPGCLYAPHCGDGVKNGPEECDDGINDNSYGGCSPQCKLAPHCGDGQLQQAYEECDDGASNGAAFCTTQCKRVVFTTE